MARDESNRVEFGFRSNGLQLVFHVSIAILIGVTLKATTFNEALLAASRTGTSYTYQTAFLVSFGFTKALSNVVVGRMSDVYGRKIPHCLGWIAGIILGALLYTISQQSNDDNGTDNNWNWYIVANIFLGAQQGWTWTTNIFMFIDVLGPENRALASGISNSVGYLSSAITTYVITAMSIQQSFLLVLVCSIGGFIISTVGMKDTTQFVLLETGSSPSSASHDDEQMNHHPDQVSERSNDDFIEDEEDFVDEDEQEGKPAMSQSRIRKHGSEYEMVALSSSSQNTSLAGSSELDANQIVLSSSFGRVLLQTCWYNPSTAVLLIAGLMTNLITSLAWGLVLIWAKRQSLSKFQIANISSAFTFSKAAMMIVASRTSDKWKTRKPVLVGGFVTAMLGLIITAMADSSLAQVIPVYMLLLIGGIVIGCGIGSVYCVMAGSISDHTPAMDRATAIGIYKLWRDSGYAVGGLLTGLLADIFHGSFVITTAVVTGMVGVLVICISKYYREGQIAVQHDGL
ncbi:unnamed protein product [Cylindrotheca closterium]|uniref:Major facilitator superfamily (MFS) profile domain-containing protein n=1 Tax=Cylindrotheca closterium TaxID=2856 RepID=A0AAD2CEM4_9STRA|nr:unnamed protein product [Cylindrotheca closterium]